MIASFSQQTMLFIQSCVLGIIFGVVYDFFRAIRYELRLRFFGTFICDILFWVINLTLFLLFILNFANGVGRLYIMFAIILANTLYFLTFSIIILKIFRYIFKLFFGTIRQIFYFLEKFLKKFLKNTFNFSENNVQ